MVAFALPKQTELYLTILLVYLYLTSNFSGLYTDSEYTKKQKIQYCISHI